MMEGTASNIQTNMLLPPQPGTFRDREELIKYVRAFGVKQGYIVTINRSKRDRKVYLGCDRGGVYRGRQNDEYKRKRKRPSRSINCPFEATGKREGDVWVLQIKNGEHNHEALKDISEHPYSKRFTEEEFRVIKEMTEAGIKPRQVMETLKQSNPELHSTPRHLYNIKYKIRQGNLSEKGYKGWWLNKLVDVDAIVDGAYSGNNQQAKMSNYISGKFLESEGSTIDVVNPATQEVVTKVPLSTYEEFKAAVSAAKQVFSSWKNTSIDNRRRIMFKLQELIRRDIEKLAMIITTEQGRTTRGARGDIIHALEVIEHVCGIASLQNGEFVPNASSGIDTYSFREPLGVCAGICHSDFPATTPLWMFPIALTFGNTFVLKPPEKNPGFSMMLATLAMEAGLPDGVLNIVHGTNDIVNHICDDDSIKAVSLVGSNIAGMHIHARASSRGKRVQADVGLKYSAIIMPDACEDASLDALVGAGFGALGHRCMSLSTVIFVGGSTQWEEGLVQRAKALKVNGGTDFSSDLGPVISMEVKDRICRSVQRAVESGARLALDGRNIKVPGYHKGNFFGPTILFDVTTNMECFKEDIFGPVLLCMKADSLDDAITMINGNKFVNGASIFTVSGVTARKFQTEIEAGLVGVNLPVPVPLPFSSSTALNSFLVRDPNLCGNAAVQFYTKIKTVAQQWNLSPKPSTYRRQASNEGRTSPSSSDGDPMSHEISLSATDTSESEMLRQDGSLMASLTKRDLVGEESSVAAPASSRIDLSSKLNPVAADSAEERDMTNQRFSTSTGQSSEGVYLPRTSDWSDGHSPASQRAGAVSQSSGSFMSLETQRIDAAAQVLQGNADQNRNLSPVSQSAGASILEASQRIGMSLNPRLDQLGSMSQRSDRDVHLMTGRACIHGNCHTDNSDTKSSQKASERGHLSTSFGHDGFVLASEHSKTAEHSNSDGGGVTMMSQQHQNPDFHLQLQTDDHFFLSGDSGR